MQAGQAPPDDRVNIFNDFDEEDIALIPNLQDFPEFVDDVIDLYVKHENIFLLCLITQILLEIVFDILSVYFRAETYEEVTLILSTDYLNIAIAFQMKLIYVGLDDYQIQWMYWSFLSGDHSHLRSFHLKLNYLVDIFFCLIYYPMGLLAIQKRSVKILSWFTTMSLVGLFLQMLLAYINK
jgi:hypothetical protein